MTTTDTPRTDAKSPEFVSDLHGWYDNFLSGRRYYISGGNGQVRRFMDARMLEGYGREFTYVKKETLRFGFYPDFPNHLLGQLQQAIKIAEVFESELDEYHSVDRNCPDSAWHYPDGWERSRKAKDKLEALKQTNK